MHIVRVEGASVIELTRLAKRDTAGVSRFQEQKGIAAVSEADRMREVVTIVPSYRCPNRDLDHSWIEPIAGRQFYPRCLDRRRQ